MDETGFKHTDCLVATGALNHDGYKRVKIDGRLWMLHRWTWIGRFGPIPDGYELHHTCKNRACYNTDHLELIEKSAHKSLSNRERKGTGYFKAKRTRNSKGQFIHV